MGSKGDSLASEYIIQCFTENKLVAPYQNGTSYYQTITATRKKLGQAEFIIEDKKYATWNGWGFGLRNMESVQTGQLPVVFAGYGIENNRYNDFTHIDVKGKAVILLSGQPQDSTGTYLLSGTKQAAAIASYQTVLREKGAALILMYAPALPRMLLHNKNLLSSRSIKFPLHKIITCLC